MSYGVLIKTAAWNEIMDLPVRMQERIFNAIEKLELDPRPAGVTKMEGSDDIYRIGDYRVIYEIRDEELIVLVVKVGQRKEVYRGY